MAAPRPADAESRILPYLEGRRRDDLERAGHRAASLLSTSKLPLAALDKARAALEPAIDAHVRMLGIAQQLSVRRCGPGREIHALIQARDTLDEVQARFPDLWRKYVSSIQ